MVTVGESRRRAFGRHLLYFCRLSVHLRLCQNIPVSQQGRLLLCTETKEEKSQIVLRGLRIDWPGAESQSASVGNPGQ